MKIIINDSKFDDIQLTIMNVPLELIDFVQKNFDVILRGNFDDAEIRLGAPVRYMTLLDRWNESKPYHDPGPEPTLEMAQEGFEKVLEDRRWREQNQISGLVDCFCKTVGQHLEHLRHVWDVQYAAGRSWREGREEILKYQS